MTWNEFLPMSMRLTLAPSQHHSPVGQEHDRTIPLPDQATFFSAIIRTDERAPSITLPHESYRSNQPLRRIGPVIGLLRGLDVVEKGPIDNRPPRGSDWGKQDRSARRVRTGNRFTPLLKPVCQHGAVGAARNPIKKGRLVQQRMAHAAVTPVE